MDVNVLRGIERARFLIDWGKGHQYEMTGMHRNPHQNQVLNLKIQNQAFRLRIVTARRALVPRSLSFPAGPRPPEN